VSAIAIRPPGPKPRPFFGSLGEFRKNPAAFLEKNARQYGDFVYLRIGPQHIYLLSHPDTLRDVLVTRQAQFKKSRMLERAKILLGDGLLTSEGKFHLRQRRLVQPAFHLDRLISYAMVMSECAVRCRDRWSDGETLDISREMMRLTLAIVTRALFSTNIDAEADEIGLALADVFGMFDMILMPYSEWLEKLPLPQMRRFYRARARLDATIYRIIAERRANPRDTGDLLSMLLAARDEDDGGVMTDQQVRDEALTLFVAGHETTAVAAGWAWHLLAQNPEAEARMHAELDTVLDGKPPTFEDLPKLRYTAGVFAETLRLYPPAWAIGRRALEDYRAGEFTVPAGAIVLLCPYIVQRDARWFPEPLKFSPERWLTEDSSRPKFAYAPFGGGARVCIGERFASMEGVLVLAAIAQRWRFRAVQGDKVDIRPLLTLRALRPIRMVAQKRAG
jgi:cytochrome P450